MLRRRLLKQVDDPMIDGPQATPAAIAELLGGYISQAEKAQLPTSTTTSAAREKPFHPVEALMKDGHGTLPKHCISSS